MKTTKVLLPVAIVLLNALGAFAAPVISELTVSVPLQATPWGPVTVTLPQFDQGMYPGYELQEVCFILEGTADSDVSVTAVESTTILSGDVGAFIQATNFSAGTLTLNAIPSGSFAPPALTMTSGQVANYDLTGTDTDSILLTSGLAAYIGTGTITADLTAVGTNSVQTAGGNYDLSQTTTASGTLKVQYKGILVPEPNSMVLALGGFLLLGLRVRKKA